MRLMILGGAGMLGHELARYACSRLDAVVTLRGPARPLPGVDLEKVRGGVDARDPASVARALEEAKPAAVINCIGVIKQLKEAKDPEVSIGVNSLFPHLLFRLCSERGIRLIHLSTDCVFSGKKGRYTEEDPPDAQDLYGRTKLLGEVSEEGALTIRTSMIGRELTRHVSLLDWFLTTPEKRIRGYRHAIFSGFTTPALCRILCDVILPRPALSGLYHVSSEPIDKFTLLSLLRARYRRETPEIVPDSEFACDRSLDSARFRRETGFIPPSWESMISDLPAQPEPLEVRS